MLDVLKKIDYSKLSLRIFKFSGVYFPTEDSPIEKRCQLIWGFTLLFPLWALGLLLSYSSYNYWLKNDVPTFSLALSFDVLDTLVLFMAIIVIFRRKKINKLMALLRTKLYQPTTAIEEIIYWNTQKYLSYFAVLMAFLGFLAWVLLGLAPFAFEKKSLAKPWLLPYEFKNEEYTFWFYYTYQVLHLFGGIVLVNAASFLVYLYGHVIMQYKFMSQRVRALAETMKSFQNLHVQGRKAKENRVIREILRHEQSVIQFVKDINAIMEVFYAVLYIATAFSICFNLYQVLFVKQENLVLFVFSMTFSFDSVYFFFVFCYVGNEIKFVNEDFYRELYEMVDLESLTISTRKSICIMMSYHSSRYVKLTGGPFIELTLESFLKVLKTSYSYLNVARNNS